MPASTPRGRGCANQGTGCDASSSTRTGTCWPSPPESEPTNVVDLPGAGALALVTLEWVGLGWLSGVRFPSPGGAAASWALRVLVGGCLVAAAQLLLALIGPGFANIPLTLL